MKNSDLVFIGIKGSVVALIDEDAVKLWRLRIPTSSYSGTAWAARFGNAANEAAIQSQCLATAGHLCDRQKRRPRAEKGVAFSR